MTTLPRLDHRNAARPIPVVSDAPLAPMSGQGILDHEPLVRITYMPGVTALHAYKNAGHQEAVDEPFLRLGARMALSRAIRSLPRGYGLGVWDAWRPLSLQKRLAEHYGYPDGYVSPPSEDPRTPPPHLTGGTVDLTLTLDGEPLLLGTDFDDFTEDAAPHAWEHRDDGIRDHRRVLFWSMCDAGFVPYPLEWWHFEIGTRRFSPHNPGGVWYGAASLPAL